MTQKAAIMFRNVKLYYFNLTGRAEHIRYLFAAKGIKFEDVRVPIVDWPQFKPKTPFGGLPVLEIDGQMVGQSLATGRMAAKIAGLYGAEDVVQQGQIDSIVETMNELREARFDIYDMPPSAEKEQEVDEFVDKKVAPVAENLSKILNGNSFFVNNKLSWADIHLFTVNEVLGEMGHKNVLSQHQNLCDLNKRVAEIPGIVEYLKNRPEMTDYHWEK